jgi:hypothetical protein
MSLEWDCCISSHRSGFNQPTVTISSISSISRISLTSNSSNATQFFGVHITEIQGRFFCSWRGREVMGTGAVPVKGNFLVENRVFYFWVHMIGVL